MSPQRFPLTRALVTGLTVAVFGFTTQAQEPAPKKALLGFTASGSEKERALETQFDGVLTAENLRTWMKRLAARPHHVGSPYDKDNADFIAGLFKSWGYDTTIETFDVLFPTPTVRLLEMVGPDGKPLPARIAEPTLREDSTSSQTREQLPVYNAYSIDGDV